jgi:OPA family glycerol-3-phosphate transporter-like MFS transporter 1/2
MMATNTKHLPAGLKLLKRLRGGKDLNANSYRTSVLIITFISYAFYHMSRKPPSIVKTVLDPEDNIHSSPHYSLPPLHTWPANYLLAAANSNAKGDAGSNVLAAQESTRRNARAAAQTNGTGLISSISSIEYDEGWSKSSRDDGELTTLQQGRGWPPFDGKTGKARLGEVDLAFLASYAIGMYFAGHLGDRLHLRLFLTAGMAISGFFVCLFGLGYWLDIHSFSYFIGVQMFAGLFQATGWPSVVTVVGNWHGLSRRGLIMGIWNAHTSAGNILGSLIAAAVLKYGWGWSFLLPGLLLASGGLVIFLFLVVEPADVGLPSPHKEDAAQGRLAVNYGGRDAEDVGQARDENVKLKEVASDGEEDLEEGCHDSQTEIQQLLDLKDNEKKQAMPFFYKTDPDAIGFLEGWRIPGVATFALCLFFAKLVAYTFLYWLPFYIRHTRECSLPSFFSLDKSVQSIVDYEQQVVLFQIEQLALCAPDH